MALYLNSLSFVISSPHNAIIPCRAAAAQKKQVAQENPVPYRRQGIRLAIAGGFELAQILVA
jgi:hypothetical protein